MSYKYDNTILLIGGMSVGKSTVSKLLGSEFGIPVVSIDGIRSETLDKTPNHSFEKQLEIRKEKGYKGEMEYLIPFTNLVINKVLDDINIPAIIDLGAFFKDQIDINLANKIKQFKHVIYLYPEDKLEILKRRNIDPNSEIGKIYLETLDNPIYDELCTKKINIDNLSPEDILKEIINNKKTNYYS